MTQSLTRRQAVALGLAVVAAAVLAVVGLVRIGAKQGVWADTFDVTVGFPEAHDINPGTAVRVRGVEAGQVVGVDYPAADAPDAVVTLRLRLDAKFADRLYADASAQVHSTSLLGARVIAVTPGTPAAGPLADGRLKATSTPDLAQAAAKIGAAADEAAALVKEARTSNGTVAKLVRDDDVYQDLKGLVKDSRTQVNKLDAFVTDGRDTLRSIKRGTDAIALMPVIRGYIPEDAASLMVRPAFVSKSHFYNVVDLFEPGTAFLTDVGKGHLQAEVRRLKELTNDDADVVVASLSDPADPAVPAATAPDVTQKRAAAVVQFFKDQGAHKMGWWTRRKLSAVGLGTGPHPVPPGQPTPPGYVQIVVLTPP